MKTICVILLTIGWTGLMCEIVCAATSGDALPQTERAVTPHSPVRRQTDTLSPRERAGLEGGKTATQSARRKAALQQGKTDILFPKEKAGLQVGKTHSTLSPRGTTGLRGGDHRPLPSSPNGEGKKSRNTNPLPRGEGVPRSGTGEGSFGTINTAPVGPPGLVRPTGATVTNVRHRGANPATVGGLGNRTASNIGSIDGTRMHRRP